MNNRSTPETDASTTGGCYGIPGNTVTTEFARKLERERDELADWKRQSIEVSPPLHDIGRELGLTLGSSIHDKILPMIVELKRKLAEANEIIEAFRKDEAIYKRTRDERDKLRDTLDAFRECAASEPAPKGPWEVGP
jgi:hypothetical protein